MADAQGSEVASDVRKYAMVRIAKGDYIQPSNDGATLWRIYSYQEDESAEYQDANGKWHPVTGTYWATAKYDRPFHNQGEWTDHDFLEWGNWLTWHTGFKTRRDAMKAALRVS